MCVAHHGIQDPAHTCLTSPIPRTPPPLCGPASGCGHVSFSQLLSTCLPFLLSTWTTLTHLPILPGKPSSPAGSLRTWHTLLHCGTRSTFRAGMVLSPGLWTVLITFVREEDGL